MYIVYISCSKFVLYMVMWIVHKHHRSIFVRTVWKHRQIYEHECFVVNTENVKIETYS